MQSQMRQTHIMACLAKFSEMSDFFFLICYPPCSIQSTQQPQQPTASNQQLPASSQQPAAAASSQQPAASSQQPTTNSQQPATSSQQPASINNTIILICSKQQKHAKPSMYNCAHHCTIVYIKTKNKNETRY